MQILGDFQASDLVDVAIVAVLLWALIVWIRTTRARLAFLGLAILGALYLLAQQLDLALTTFLFQGFFAAVALVMVVVFQDDLRRLFERIAVTGLGRRQARTGSQVVEALARALAAMARTRIGALVVVPGRDPLDRHLEGGIPLGGQLSEALLLSLFDPYSPGHDGAVVLEGNQVERFGARLPLSTNAEGVGAGGTRHLAALGLAERSDALCIAVSEERGTVTLAHDGALRVVPAGALAAELRRFLRESNPRRSGGRLGPLLRAIPARWREGFAAAGLAAGLWLVFVPGDARVEFALPAAVEVENLPAGYVLEAVEPAEVEVRVVGRRRDLVLAKRSALRVRVDALLVQLGRRTFEVGPAEVEHPPELRVSAVTPAKVRLSVLKTGNGAERGPGAEG